MHSLQLPNYLDYVDLFNPEIGKPKRTTEAARKDSTLNEMLHNLDSYTYGFDIEENIKEKVIKLIDDVRDVCNKYFLDTDDVIELGDIVRNQGSPALMVYYPNGRFDAHNHLRGPALTAVVSIEDYSSPVFFIEHNDKRREYSERAGEIKLFDPILIHGVMPVQRTRRVIVIDYTYKVNGKLLPQRTHGAVTFQDDINA